MLLKMSELKNNSNYIILGKRFTNQSHEKSFEKTRLH